jgi:dethiobiotin synthetase
VHRYFVTGTDTDVGKTRVTAALALALRQSRTVPTIVKLVQTGLRADESGDAKRASDASGCESVEFLRFAAPADPWSAALAAGTNPPAASALVLRLNEIASPVVVEGAGGIAVPLNATESFADVAKDADLSVVLAIGLRLGCMNHTSLTLALCEARGIRVAGVALVERWAPMPESYLADVRRTLGAKLPELAFLPFDADESRSVRGAAQQLIPFVQGDLVCDRS